MAMVRAKTQAMTSDRRDAGERHDAAMAMIESGRREVGLSMLRDLVRTHPNHVASWESLGLELYRDGVTEEASKCFDAALALEPDRLGSRLGATFVLESRGELETAEASYRRICEDCGESGLALSLFADFLAGQNRIDEARSLFEQALRVDPDEVSALRKYATLLSVLDQDDEAEKLFRRALLLRADDPHTLYLYGRFLSQFAGREQDALNHLERAAEHGEGRAAALVTELKEALAQDS